ncbi:MAG: TIGR02281 family clan AA aspartic protease [Candidatus Bipolaricaulia bacterium]
MSRRGDRIVGQRAHGGVLLVPCLLNDVARYWLLADTGAALTMITPHVASELGVDAVEPIRRERLASLHRSSMAPVIRLESLQIGSLSLHDVEALVLPFPRELRLDGLIGVNVLNRFRATFAFDERTLVLR